MENCGWLAKVVALFCGLFFVLFLVMCLFQMHKSGNPASRNVLPDSIPQKIEIIVTVSDSTVDPLMMAKLDSTVKAVNLWNNYCENELIQGLNDLRQETNNVIDKQNGWLSFWIAILALVGTLLPFAVQLKLQFDEKQKVKEVRDELTKALSDQAKSKLYADISKLSFTLINCYDNKWSRDNIDRDDFWNDMLADLCKQTNKFIDSIVDTNDLHNEYAFYLKMILMQLHAVYCVYIPIFSKSYKSRQLLELTHKIADILGKLTNNKYSSMQELRGQLEIMQMHMSRFHL